MASSLDDMEPYEILQQELDERLKNYEKYLMVELPAQSHNKAYFLINQFIEYICFVKSYASFDEINQSKVFISFYESLPDSDFTQEQTSDILLNFLNFK